MLESDLIRNDRRLRVEPGNPETIIACQITRFGTNEQWENRRETERKKTGERQEWNQKKQKYETKEIYTDVEVTKRYKVVSGEANVSYQITDVKTKSQLDAGNIPAIFSNSFLDGNGAPVEEQVAQYLLRLAVARIVPRLTPTNESVKVLLAQGKLKDLSKFGEASLWQKMVESFEMMQPLKNPKDDAYRLYNIGVGYEALAYQAEDLSTTMKFLEKAAINYGKAIEMKIEEKYFREPQLRIETAITHYKKLSEQIAMYSKAKALEANKASAVVSQNSKSLSNSAPASPTSQIMTNQSVIEMVSFGMNEGNLLTTINNPGQQVKFDLSANGQIELLKNKVSNTVIAAMRKRQSIPTLGRPKIEKQEARQAAITPPLNHPTKGQWTLQAASFNNMPEAQAQLAQFRQQGIEARIVKGVVGGKVTWYRIQINRFGSREAAERFGKELVATGKINGFMVTKYQAQ